MVCLVPRMSLSLRSRILAGRAACVMPSSRRRRSRWRLPIDLPPKEAGTPFCTAVSVKESVVQSVALIIRANSLVRVRQHKSDKHVDSRISSRPPRICLLSSPTYFHVLYPSCLRGDRATFAAQTMRSRYRAMIAMDTTLHAEQARSMLSSRKSSMQRAS